MRRSCADLRSLLSASRRWRSYDRGAAGARTDANRLARCVSRTGRPADRRSDRRARSPGDRLAVLTDTIGNRLSGIARSSSARSSGPSPR